MNGRMERNRIMEREGKCPECGKRFFSTADWVYRTKSGDRVFCSWKCLRDSQRREAEQRDRERQRQEERLSEGFREEERRKILLQLMSGKDPYKIIEDMGIWEKRKLVLFYNRQLSGGGRIRQLERMEGAEA